MAVTTSASSSTNERAPLLPPHGVGSESRHCRAPLPPPPLGTARLPFHPMAPATPLWRTLLLQFFDGHEQIDVLRERDVWPLPPAVCGRRPADAIRSHLPAHGRVRLVRSVWAANTRLFLWIVWLDVVAIVIAVLRPLLLLALFENGLLPIVGSSDRRHWGAESSVVVPLIGIFSAEIALAIVSGQRRHAACQLQLTVNRGLFTLVVDRVVDSEASTATHASAASARLSKAPVGHKQQLTEVAQMLSTDLRRASFAVVGSEEAWPMVARFIVSLVVFVRVVDLSWLHVVIAVGSYVVVVVVEGALGMAFGGTFVSARMTRVSAVRECLKSILTVKLSGWETAAEHKIQQARAIESSAWRRFVTIMLLTTEVMKESPLLVATVAFAWLTRQSVESTAVAPTAILAQVFTGLIVLNDVANSAGPFMGACQLFSFSLAAWYRIELFLLDSARCDQLSSASSVSPDPVAARSTDGIFEMRGVCMKHTSQAPSAPPILVNVDWRVRRGELVVVYGAAGVGKSTLLAAIRDGNATVQVSSGSLQRVSSDCRVAYCSQEPWLQSKSIRDNIVFGAAFNTDKYWAVVDACSLLEDLSVLAAGDMTVVGSNGINLSGGQSARIALARACYADADLYLLDCPLANVDAVVQSEIFRKCIVELLMFKTVVVVTHNPEYIGSSYVDQLVEVKPLTVRSTSRKPSPISKDENSLFINRRMRDDREAKAQWSLGECPLHLSPLGREAQASVASIEQLLSESQAKNTLMPEREVASVARAAVVAEYVLGAGAQSWIWLVCGAVVLMLWGMTCAARDVWIVLWAEDTIGGSLDATRATATYVSLVAATIVLGIAVQISVFGLNAATADRLFSRMVHGVVHAPMAFFYATSTGAAINRFYTDMAVIDTQFPTFVSLFLLSAVAFIERALVLAWLLGPSGAIVAIVGYGIMLRLLSIGFYAQLMTMEHSASQQQLSILSDLLDGEAVLRAFGDCSSPHVSALLEATNEFSDRVWYLSTEFNSYMLLREQIVAAIVGLAFVAVLASRSVTPAELLLVLLYLFTLQHEFFIKFATGLVNVYMGVGTIQRLQEYSNITAESESDWTTMNIVSTDSSSEPWPPVGQIVFENVRFAYADKSTDVDSRLALRDVSFSLRGGEKVGVIGRTGSGKSSLAMALLRVHPLRSGRILLDGVDVRTVPLAQLRRSFTMIPQSPTFYRCSIRDYLDPFHEFDDARLWKELLTVELGPRVQSLEEELLDNGENWSLGQRQLLCFARALLTPSRVVVLDEAFSCVDQSCQEKILRILRERFARSTVVLITHRLDQILAFDRIVVMKGGRVVENGSAAELASDAGSVFYEFLETSLLTF